MARIDILELVRAARASGLYVNFITSGLPLDEGRLSDLVAAGVDHLQLSFQGAREETAADISGSQTHAQKLKVLQWLAQHRIGVTLNFVIHGRNIEQIPEMLAIAESSSAGRVEFANVQYYGYALANRANLLPTRDQVTQSIELLRGAQERLKGKIRIEFVVPDYYARFPKPCMGGWARKLMLIKPNGDALPCHAAEVIAGLHFDNVKERGLREIWENSEAFQQFRGQEWMQEPCKSCDRRELDFGGCRCQAMLLAADPSATDPVCSLSPHRAIIEAILAVTNSLPVEGELEATRGLIPADALRSPWLYRPNPT